MNSSIRRISCLSGILLVVILLGSSCGQRLPERISMDPNPVFSGGIGWIVVSEAYARVKAEPSLETRDIGHLRGGDLLQVLGRDRSLTDGSLWYKVRTQSGEGWMPEGEALFFETRDAASRAASRVK